MCSKLGIFILLASLAASVQARATVLPDSCGKDEVKFKVKMQEGQPPPIAPEAGKAQIVFIEVMEKTGIFTGDATTRVGMDGAWMGANKGDSYFTLSVPPGEHHLCVDWQANFGPTKEKYSLLSFTAEAGGVYYFQAKVTVISEAAERSLILTRLSEDEGKYRVKASPFSIATHRP